VPGAVVPNDELAVDDHAHREFVKIGKQWRHVAATPTSNS
jgi:hypothetical protein